MYRDTNEIAITKLPLDKPCYYPFYQVAIDYNGTVLLCPHDWSKEYIAGNAFEISIWDIWRSPKFEIVRNLLANSTRSTNPCRKCDVEGTLIGRENFAAFSTKSDA